MSAEKVGPLTEQAKLKTHQVKWVEAIEVVKAREAGISISLAEQYARSQPRCIEARKEEAAAAGELIGLNERRDTAKITISLTQSLLRDRL